MPGRPHADHNEKLCDYLIKEGGFDDWVVTTAFYSAVHLVDHQIFPLTITPQPTFANFPQYYSRLPAPRPGRHEARKELVYQQLPKCYGAFSWLMDECHNARYNDYQVPPDFAKRAKGALEKIKSVCTKT